MTTKLTAEEPSSAYKFLREQLAVSLGGQDWEFAKLGSQAEFVMGQAPPGTECNSKQVGSVFVKAGEFGLLYPQVREWTTKPLRFARDGDVLICVVGATAGKLNLAINCAIGRSVAAIRPRNGLQAKFLYYQLLLQVERLRASSAGSAQGVISKPDLANIQVVVAAPERQQRVVAYLDEQLSRLDASVAALLRAQANLKRYRASVLKAACEGHLVPTEAELARADDRGLESGTQLLHRVLGERRVQDRAIEGRAKPDIRGLSDLPEAWTWTSADQLLDGIEAGKSFKCDERPPHENEVGVLKVSAVTWSEFNEGESKTCTDAEKVDARYIVRPGDFLFSRANTVDLVGACVIVNDVRRQLMLSDKTLRLSVSDAVAPKWLLYCLRSKLGRSDIERLSTGNQESMRNIGQARIRQIRVPLPPLAEQHRIVAEADRRLSLIRAAEAQVTANLARAKRLRQSILQAAFSPGAHVAPPA